MLVFYLLKSRQKFGAVLAMIPLVLVLYYVMPDQYFERIANHRDLGGRPLGIENACVPGGMPYISRIIASLVAACALWSSTG
jgi:hypothetical protein